MSWRGSAGGIKAAKLGHDVIMTPNSHFYFDYYQSPDADAEPFGIGGCVTIDKVYSFDPMADLTPGQQAHILGVQANLWTEYIASDDHLEYMLLPRLAALSEVQWCQPGVKDWVRFRDGFRMDRIYSQMGYVFAKHIFGIKGSYAVDPQKGAVVMTLTTPGRRPDPLYARRLGTHGRQPALHGAGRDRQERPLQGDGIARGRRERFLFAGVRIQQVDRAPCGAQYQAQRQLYLRRGFAAGRRLPQPPGLYERCLAGVSGRATRRDHRHGRGAVLSVGGAGDARREGRLDIPALVGYGVGFG